MNCRRSGSTEVERRWGSVPARVLDFNQAGQVCARPRAASQNCTGAIASPTARDFTMQSLIPLAIFLLVALGGFLLTKSIQPAPPPNAYREFLFEPAQSMEMPQAAWDHLQAYSAEMLAARLVSLGDFVLWREPGFACARYFAAPNGQYFGSITYHRRLLTSFRSCEFWSVLADGTYVETVRCRQPWMAARPKSALHFEFLPWATVEQLSRRHLQTLERLCAERGTEVLEFASDQFQAVAIHGHRLVGWDIHMKGFRPEPPPAIGRSSMELAG